LWAVEDMFKGRSSGKNHGNS